MSHRDMYLEDIPLEDALTRFWGALDRADALQPLEGEEVPVVEALGRVTAAAVFAPASVPHYQPAAKDSHPANGHRAGGRWHDPARARGHRRLQLGRPRWPGP